MRRLTLLAAAMVVGLAVSTPAGAALKVGVVDIVGVTNNYDRTKDANADIQVEQANFKAAADPKVAALEDVRLKRDGFNKGTKEWQQLDDQVLKTQAELSTWMQIERIKIERRHQEVLLDMYRQMTDAIGRIAKAKSIDLVFTTAFLEPPQIDVDKAIGLQDLQKRIVGQRVLYPTEVTDITQDVLKILNDEYKARKAAGKAKG
ncbi:MAG TPA: OmpH family outer membrane protein [Phycisphaerae bacterium]|nr:OmpH family outer membrane protein [Phycisphaerae bacterium]